MWSAIGDTLPLAVGLALSPVALATAVMLLLGSRGRVKTALFGVGWFVVLLVITAIAAAIVDVADDDAPEATKDGVDIVLLVIAVLFAVLALVAWKKRPKEGDEEKPSILDRLDGLSVWGALAMGFAQGVIVIKNIPLAAAAGARLGEADLDTAALIVGLVVFALVAASGVIIPLVLAVLGGERAAPILARFRDWLSYNMTTISIVVLFVLSAYFFGQGIGILD